MTEVNPQCVYCKHWRGGRVCAAFDYIPDDIIILGTFDHREPYPGDNGIQYEPIDEEPANGINNDNRTG